MWQLYYFRPDNGKNRCQLGCGSMVWIERGPDDPPVLSHSSSNRYHVVQVKWWSYVGATWQWQLATGIGAQLRGREPWIGYSSRVVPLQPSLSRQELDRRLVRLLALGPDLLLAEAML